MDIKRILEYQEHGDDGLFIEGMYLYQISKVNEYYRLFCRMKTYFIFVTISQSYEMLTHIVTHRQCF